jgi:hypothetical protein
VHFHLLVLDGIYRREGEDRLRFVPVPAPSTEELKRLVQRIVPKTCAAAANESGEASATDRQRALTWAQRLKRVFAIDIETCRQCGGRLRVIASIEAPAVIERILEHLGRDAESIDPAYPSRARLGLRPRAARARRHFLLKGEDSPERRGPGRPL